MKKRAYGCGLEAALDVVGGKWKPIVLWHLSPSSRRFGELRRLVTGISEKMLIQQLREMETDGIVERKDFQEVPPRVQYSLTPFGISLTVALRPLCDWGTTHLTRIEATKAQGQARADEVETIPTGS
jgi:DNA-binding HxlR family transcriptional regulator